ncbi:MAG: hypothetical protein ACXVWU_09250 [Nocardioides sp.]
MYPIAEPFLSAELAYRRQRTIDAYHRHPTRLRRRFHVPRRRGLRLPVPHRRHAAVA